MRSFASESYQSRIIRPSRGIFAILTVIETSAVTTTRPISAYYAKSTMNGGRSLKGTLPTHYQPRGDE